MAFMTWSEDLITGIDVVDRQHHHLVTLIDEAAELLLESEAVDEGKVDKLFAGLMDYAAMHFRTEEELMVKQGIDGRVLKHHHQTHLDFVEEVTGMAQQFQHGELQRDHLLGYLAGWLLFHTLGEDQTMARQVHAMEAGIPSDRAYIEAEGARLAPERDALARTMVTLYTQLSGQLHELELHGKHFEGLVQERTAHLNALTIDLARARDAAEAGSRAKSRFIGAISHELRTPMNAVLGFSRLLQGEQLPSRQAGLADKIVKASEHLVGLINDVIDYAGIDSGLEDDQRVSFALRPTIEEACFAAFQAAQGRGIACRVDIDPALPALLKGDVRRIISALRHLADNAAKFTERGTILVQASPLTVEPDRIRVRFTVWDSGIGIAEEHQARLFQAFQQLDDSAARKYAGIGLGLALAHHLVLDLGGEIGVNSLPGRGSRFWIDIWLARGEEETMPKPVSPARTEPAVPKPAPSAVKVETAQTEATLAQVRELLRQDDTRVGELFESAAPMLRDKLGEHFDEVVERITGFEFDRALELLDELVPTAERDTEKNA